MKKKVVQTFRSDIHDSQLLSDFFLVLDMKNDLSNSYDNSWFPAFSHFLVLDMKNYLMMLEDDLWLMEMERKPTISWLELKF